MNYIKAFSVFVLLVSLLTSCAPQTVDITPTQPEPTQTSVPPTATSTFTPLPTETALPTDTPSPTPPSCAVPLNPADNAAVPARGPFDFTWTAFEGAVSYIVSIGPKDWYPTNFPVSGTTLTRYMETFPSSPSYEWSIIALNAGGQQLCTAGPYEFVTSKDMRATPSFEIKASSGGEPTEVTSIDSGPDLSANVIVEEYGCGLVATVQIGTRAPKIDGALFYGTDPNHLDNEKGLSTSYPKDSLGIGTFQFEIFNQYHKGETVYFLVKVKAAKRYAESQLVSHTIPCDPP